uniref:Uncharacterized protein n=1 Tax=viral metagenome TaxID=1070528 RepID=A0A6M3LW56_9ZZZZ
MSDTREMDDLEWLEAHWLQYYKSDMVKTVFSNALSKLGGKGAREIIKEMRDYQEKGEGV